MPTAQQGARQPGARNRAVHDRPRPPLQANCMVNHFQRAYAEALELAKQQLLSRDIEQVCRHAGARRTGQGRAVMLELPYLSVPVFLQLPGCTFSGPGASAVHVWDQILLLHYLSNARPTPSGGRQISFKELKSAALYYRLFESRCLKPLLSAFGGEPAQLTGRAAALGGSPFPAGDAAVRLAVLPRIAVSCIVWKADDEFPASASMLFDAAIERLLSPEDIVVMCQRMTQKLLQAW